MQLDMALAWTGSAAAALRLSSLAACHSRHHGDPAEGLVAAASAIAFAAYGAAGHGFPAFCLFAPRAGQSGTDTMARVVARRAHAPAGLFPDSRNTRFAGCSGEPLRPKGVHPLTLCFRVHLRVQIHFGDAAAAAFASRSLPCSMNSRPCPFWVGRSAVSASGHWCSARWPCTEPRACDKPRNRHPWNRRREIC